MASFLDIAPALGRAAVAAQGQPGGYDAIDFRAAWSIGKQEGVVEGAAWKVTQRAAGANMSVDVAANVGHALVKGDTVALTQGLYTVRPHPVVANLDVGAAHATLPRIDQVVLEVKDNEHDASGLTRARVYVLAGAATAGATLDNRNGAAALPATTVRLADVLVPAASSSVVNANIRDRRPWAQGAHFAVVQPVSSDYTTTSGSDAAIDTTNLSRRLETAGDVEIIFSSSFFASQVVNVDLYIDGTFNQRRRMQNTGGGEGQMALHYRTSGLAAGSHLIEMHWSLNGAGSATIRRSNSVSPVWVVDERITQNASN